MKHKKRCLKRSGRQPRDDSSLCRNSWAVTGEDMKLGTSLKQVVHSGKKNSLKPKWQIPPDGLCVFLRALSGSQKSSVRPSGVTRRMKVCDRLSRSLLLVWLKRPGKILLKVPVPLWNQREACDGTAEVQDVLKSSYEQIWRSITNHISYPCVCTPPQVFSFRLKLMNRLTRHVFLEDGLGWRNRRACWR